MNNPLFKAPIIDEIERAFEFMDRANAALAAEHPNAASSVDAIVHFHSDIVRVLKGLEPMYFPIRKED